MNDKISKPLKYVIADAIHLILNENNKKYATLNEIYDKVALLCEKKREYNFDARIRARLQENCSYCDAYLGKEDLFEQMSNRSGKWKNKITGEKEFKKYLISIVKKIPNVDITVIKENALKLLYDKLTYADKLPSISRNGEIKFEQIVRNIISHKNQYEDVINFTEENGKILLSLIDENLKSEYDIDIKFDNIIMENVFDIETEKTLTSVEVPLIFTERNSRINRKV